MTDTQPLELIINENLAEGYKLLKAEGMHMATSAQIIDAKITNPDPRNLAFYPANVGLCGVTNGRVKFSLGEGPEFERILGNNIDEACSQLLSNGNYRLSKKDKLWVAERQKSGELPVFDLESDFWISGIENEFGYFCFSTKKKLKDSSEKTLTEIVYGKGDDFGKAMEMLVKAGKTETFIWILKPKYVLQKLREGDMVARACYLNNISGNYSHFHADARYVDDCNVALLGVRREEISVGDALKNQEIDYAYKTVISKPADA